MRNKAGNNKLLKEINRALVLDLIRTNRSISRAGLAQLTGLSPTAVGTITSSLLEDGYIHETGTSESVRGRRPVLLELKPGSYYSIGFDVDVDYLGVVLVDVTGAVVFERSVVLQDCYGIREVMSGIEDELRKVLKKFEIPLERLVGLGISIAGMVNHDSGEIVLAPNLGWSNENVGNYLKRYPGVPVFIENEAMASAVYENWIGCCKDINDFVCINVKSGIGAGIFTSGRLYRGASGSAGEVGHITVDESGPRCGCGSFGCLETMTSTHYIVEKAKRLVRQGIVSSLNDIEDVEGIGIETIVEAARQGDEASKGMLMESARYLGIAITNIVNMLNPSKVVLGKEFVKYSDIVMDYIRDFVSSKALKAPAARVDITASLMGERSSGIGAAIIPLKVLFGR